MRVVGIRVVVDRVARVGRIGAIIDHTEGRIGPSAVALVAADLFGTAESSVVNALAIMVASAAVVNLRGAKFSWGIEAVV